MMRHQLGVDVRKTSGRPCPDSAAPQPTEGHEEYRIAVDQRLQNQRWQEVSRVRQAPEERRDVTLAEVIAATGHSCAIAPEQNCVRVSSSNLRVGQVSNQRGNVTLAMPVQAT